MKNMEKALASQGQSWKIMEWEFKKKIGQEKFLGFAPFSKKGQGFGSLNVVKNDLLLLNLIIVTLK